MARKALWGVLIGILSLMACTQNKPIRWIGCDVAKNGFMAALAEEYQKRYETQITMEASGDTKGIRALAAGEADLSGSCRDKLDVPEEENAVLVPIAWDALVMMVNPANPVDSITTDQARKIFLGEIENWSQLGGADAPIDLCVRPGKISGVGRMVRLLLFQNAEQDFTPKAIVYPSSEHVEAAVAENPNAIGVSGLSSAQKQQVIILNLDGVTPNKANVMAGKYNFCRPLYLIYHKNYDERLVHFIRFAWGPTGQEIISQQGAINLEEGAALARIFEKEMARVKALPELE
jgi:phosphate transport system substrate-binding protein